jgi:iron(II)-dependent oxidoreductase
MRLFSIVPDETNLRLPPAPGFRPIMWHRGHIGAYEAYWLLQRSKGEASPSAEFERIFDPIKTPRDDASSLPPLDEIEGYLASIRARALDYLGTPEGSADWETFHLVLEHELQHQETLLYLLHLVEPSRKRALDGARPRRLPALEGLVPNGGLDVPAGSFEMGSNGYPFAYDNERPVHRVEVAAFRIDRHPVTNAQFAGFVDSGGYATPEFWSEEGWAWRESKEIEHPHSWIPEGRGWRLRGLVEAGEMSPNAPVWGVSWYEADAYARWAGRRLPTEAEWEYAARGAKSRRFPWGEAAPEPRFGNFDDHFGAAAPVGSFPEGASELGCLDMTGNVWEWTASPFDGYPGFRAHPYPEYSEVWFDGDHRVAKGGSWATRAPILRASFRNFFRRDFRIGFLGFRCAE